MKHLQPNYEPEGRGEYLGNGARNNVWLTNVHVSKGNARQRLQMAVREPKPLMSSHKLYDEARTRDSLIKAGVPVAHGTYRLNDDNTKVYCTDLTRGGQFYVFSETNLTADDGEWQRRVASGEMNTPAPNCQKALRTLREIAVQCALNGFELMNADAVYFTIDKKTREISVSIGDYKHAVRSEREFVDVLENNLNIVRTAAVSRGEAFGMSADEINAWFIQKNDVNHRGTSLASGAQDNGDPVGTVA